MPGFRQLSSLVLSLALAFAIAGCTTDTQGETGTLSLELVINGDTEIDAVDWTITQGEEVIKSGMINTSAPGATASVEAYGLEPGNYTIMMEAVSTDGETTCKGKAMFDIEVDEVTEVHVMMNCKLPRQFGGVRVDGTFNICPVLTWADASPLQTSVGNDIDLFAMATDEEDNPITYMWSSGSGMGIDDPMAASTTYTCTAVGDDTITILVTDDGGTYCMDMHTFDVTCVAGDGDPCEGEICDDTGNECTTAACNPGTGLCETSNVADGTDCDGGAGMCLAGDCVAKDLCMDVVCEDDGNECTTAACNPSTGDCETSNVADGTSCGDGGACMGGSCIVTDLCEGVTCDDTGNDCTVGVCNSQTGICDEMNVTDGTACNDDTGTCLSGVCEVGNLCDTVVCVSENDCVDPGTCNPSNGMCEGGGPVMINTPCADGFCDGAGTCVECNDGTQCPDDTNQCTMAACTTNMCGQANVMNGLACDLVGTGDGMCEDGTCVAAPVCTPATAEIDCDDGNECTVHSCPDGMCVTMAEEDGATCDADGTPGSCQGGSCVGNCDPSVVVCTDTGPNAECTEDLCDPSTSPGTCSNPPVADCTSCCDAGDGANSGDCTAGVCEAPAGPDCGDVACTFATGSTVQLQTVLFPLTVGVQAGSVNVVCTGNDLDPATGKCGCFAEFGAGAPPAVTDVVLDPLPGVGQPCLVPVPAGDCPLGDVDCDGGNDQDVEVTVDHNIGACTDDASCLALCDPYCAGLGAFPGAATCEDGAAVPPDDHPGACNCTCVSVGDGTADGAGDAQLFAGFGLNVLTDVTPAGGQVGPDGIACTADDDPAITIDPQCAPFTTASASTQVLNANNTPGSSIPAAGFLSTTGAPLTCGGGIPTSASGAGLRTAAAFLDTTLGDLAARVILDCQ